MQRGLSIAEHRLFGALLRLFVGSRLRLLALQHGDEEPVSAMLVRREAQKFPGFRAFWATQRGYGIAPNIGDRHDIIVFSARQKGGHTLFVFLGQ